MTFTSPTPHSSAGNGRFVVRNTGTGALRKTSVRRMNNTARVTRLNVLIGELEDTAKKKERQERRRFWRRGA